MFENEVGLLWKLNHPAIIKVDAIFYEGLRAYIQMPYIDQGTLGQWLSTNPKPWEVQSVFRQLVQVSDGLMRGKMNKRKCVTLISSSNKTLILVTLHSGIGVHA